MVGFLMCWYRGDNAEEGVAEGNNSLGERGLAEPGDAIGASRQAAALRSIAACLRGSANGGERADHYGS